MTQLLTQRVPIWVFAAVGMIFVFVLAGVVERQFSIASDIESQALAEDLQTTASNKNSSVISTAEKTQIDAWITANNLNQYGDSTDTLYPGGTPLFDEQTGKRIDRYRYILQKHPDRPWKNN